MVLSERKEEILVSTYNHCFIVTRYFNCNRRQFCSCSFYLYTFLGGKNQTSRNHFSARVGPGHRLLYPGYYLSVGDRRDPCYSGLGSSLSYRHNPSGLDGLC